MEYMFMQPPFKIKPFKNMTKKDAQEHFEWYIGDIPNRIEMLRKAFEVSGGGKKEELDFSEKSLVKLWNWYIVNVEIHNKTKEEVENEKSKLLEWVSRNVSDQKISIGWMSIAMDIAIYFAVSFINAYSKIEWGFVSKPNRLAYVNKPVLRGFKTGVELDTTNIVRNLALKAVSGEKEPEALLRIYKVWAESV